MPNTNHEAPSTLRIATWNVNSIRTRLQQLTGWLREDKPDIVLLQETKCTNEQFPTMEIEDLGYNIAMHGEKSYNGVAILSLYPIDDITCGMPGEPTENARYIEAVTGSGDHIVRVASVYIPNGQTADSDKFIYKLSFLDAFYEHTRTLRHYDEAVVIGGDYNIAPSDIDVAHPKAWEGSVLTHDEVRKRFRMIVNNGWVDAGANDPEHSYSWWDYRAGAFAKNDGLRIDHLLLSPQAADQLHAYEVIQKLRGLEKPSDHAPVMITLK